MRLPKQLPAVDRKPDMNASASSGGGVGPAINFADLIGPQWNSGIIARPLTGIM
jgi:hypothetical protein